jgi:hypothetical protein
MEGFEEVEKRADLEVALKTINHSFFFDCANKAMIF